MFEHHVSWLAVVIHIVGLYKCGTSWLLHVLAAHPDVVAWREFDALAATYQPDHRLHQLPALARDYLSRRADRPQWMLRREAVRPREPEAIFREMFLGRGWIPLLGKDQQNRALQLARRDSHEVLDGLLELGGLSLRSAHDAPLSSTTSTRTLGVQSFRRSTLLQLMDDVRSTHPREQVPRRFFDSLRAEVEDSAQIVCKAADQVMRLGVLRKACPDARAIAIIRDGRDAAISARHYEQLMRQREAPWQVPQTSSFRRLLGWSVRAAKLAEHARRGELLVVRYEDLKQNFERSCSAVFEALGLASKPDIIHAVKTATDFRVQSAGRNPGEAAQHILRKGVVGEWQEAMSPREARLAWRMIGRELSSFGYTEHGVLGPSQWVLGAS